MKGAGTVVIADLIYAYHSLFICIVLTIQAFVYPKGKNQLSWITVMILLCLWFLIVIETILTVVISYII
jgi:hypothetical protein